LGCRIYHAGVAASQSGFTVHCDHASIMGGNMCGTWCTSYCNNAINGPCSNNTYLSMAACTAACNSFPTTFAQGGSDISANTPAKWANNVQCRMYHMAFPSMNGGQTTHCQHGWINGGLACQDPPDPKLGDHCAGYCDLYLATCSSGNLLESGVTSISDCKSKCNAITRPGFANNTNYLSVPNPSGDNLDCRAYHLTAAATLSATTHCPHAWLSASTGPCAVVGSSALNIVASVFVMVMVMLSLLF